MSLKVPLKVHLSESDPEVWRKYFEYYKFGRVVFAFSILLFFTSLSALKKGFFPWTPLIVGIYFAISLVSLFFKKINLIDFFLDIVFVSVMMMLNLLYESYITILYIVPIFFASTLIGDSIVFLLTTATILIYSVILFLNYPPAIATLKLLLSGGAYILLTYAGLNVGKRLKKQAEYIRLLEKEREEAEIYKRLYRISADLAHEIKNPLASIKGAVDLISEGVSNEALIKILKEETSRLNMIVEDFLNLSRPSSGKEVVDVAQLIKDILGPLSLKKKDIDFRIPDSLKVYNCSSKALYSAVSNILKNAIDWAKSRVSVKLERIGDKAFLTVEDDGPGIPESDREKIFEPFFTKRRGGTGLGLAIAKRVLLERGGGISVGVSEKLGGAKFVLEIPIHPKRKR